MTTEHEAALLTIPVQVLDYIQYTPLFDTMVKNQNWQKRVETADARRKEAKQRKQQALDKRQFKQWAQEFLGMLERHGEQIQVKTVHMWSSDQMVASSAVHEDGVDDVKSKRRLRAASMDGTAVDDNGVSRSISKGSRRGRSNSVNETKRKSHPRRKDSFGDDSTPPLLCQSHFFTDKCAHDTGKRGGCSYVHYSPDYKTLCQVIENGQPSQQEMNLSQQAATLDDRTRSRPGAMDMVYHTAIAVSADQSLLEQVTGFLSCQHLSLASLVYIAMDNVFVFDRNREGLLMANDRDFLILLLGENAMRSRKFSIASENKEGSEETLLSFPGAVLEHILTFLPDGAVPAVCRVCQPWYLEIGHTPNLWRHMLERRQWPLPKEQTSPESSRRVFRNEFINHYGAIRDVNAIQKALTAIKTKKTVEEKEMAYQDFSKRRHAPSHPNSCVSLQVWSQNHVLAAYSQDCSLRLFESSLKASGSQEKQCREIACQNIDPYRNTRRRSCCIMSMGLDEDYIGCLCHVESDDLDMEAYNLVVLSRDDFLLGGDAIADAGSDDSEALNLAVIDVGEAVLNFFVSSDDADHRLLMLMDFIEHGGGLDEVQVFASQTLLACGHGRFMVEVSISIPNDHHEDFHVFDRKLVLISAEIGAVLWMGDSNPLTQPVTPSHEDMLLSYMTRSHSEGLDSTCTVAIGSGSSPIITVCEIDATEQVQCAELAGTSEVVRARLEGQEEGWHTPQSYRQSILITANDVIVGDILVRVVQEAVQERRSFISFHPRHDASSEATTCAMEIPGNMEIVRMARLRDQHAIVLCRAYVAAAPLDSTPEPVGGHWLRRAQPLSSSDRTDVCAIVFHIPTRCQVGSCCLLEDIHLADAPHVTVDSGDTLGVALSWKGLVMTGNDVRYVGDDSTMNESSPPRSGKKKKKKGSRTRREGKKDEFARGMRQSF